MAISAIHVSMIRAIFFSLAAVTGTTYLISWLYLLTSTASAAAAAFLPIILLLGNVLHLV